MSRKLRLVDLALLPFGLCVLFLLLLGKLFGLTYKQISVVFNLWVQGAVFVSLGDRYLSYSSLIPKRLSLRLHSQ